jgi:hypothetical protein
VVDHFLGRHHVPHEQQPSDDLANAERVRVTVGNARMRNALPVEHQEIFIVGDEHALRGPGKRSLFFVLGAQEAGL